MTPITTVQELECARRWHTEGPFPDAQQNDFPVDRLLATIEYQMDQRAALLDGLCGLLVGVNAFGV